MLFAPGFYSLIFEVVSDSPQYYNFDILYSSEATVRLDYVIRDIPE